MYSVVGRYQAEEHVVTITCTLCCLKGEDREGIEILGLFLFPECQSKFSVTISLAQKFNQFQFRTLESFKNLAFVTELQLQITLNCRLTGCRIRFKKHRPTHLCQFGVSFMLEITFISMNKTVKFEKRSFQNLISAFTR